MSCSGGLGHGRGEWHWGRGDCDLRRAGIGADSGGGSGSAGITAVLTGALALRWRLVVLQTRVSLLIKLVVDLLANEFWSWGGQV